MEPCLSPPYRTPGTSKLFLDFSYHFDRVAHFYRHDPHDLESLFGAAAAESLSRYRRAAMVKAFSAQNGTARILDRLAEPGTVAVVTGQQVGLFSGPAYTIYKAIPPRDWRKIFPSRNSRGSRILARHRGSRFGRSRTTHGCSTKDHLPLRLKWKRRRKTRAPRPVGESRFRLRPSIASEALAGLPHADEVVAMVAAHIRPESRWAAVFAHC